MGMEGVHFGESLGLFQDIPGYSRICFKRMAQPPSRYECKRPETFLRQLVKRINAWVLYPHCWSLTGNWDKSGMNGWLNGRGGKGFQGLLQETSRHKIWIWNDFSSSASYFKVSSCFSLHTSNVCGSFCKLGRMIYFLSCVRQLDGFQLQRFRFLVGESPSGLFWPICKSNNYFGVFLVRDATTSRSNKHMEIYVPPQLHSPHHLPCKSLKIGRAPNRKFHLPTIWFSRAL